MNVPLPSEIESELLRLARLAGRDAGELAAEVLRGFIEHDAEFRASVRRGVEQADRGELVDHADVVQRIERLLK